MKRILSALVVLVFAATMASAAVATLPVVEQPTQEATAVDLQLGESFGDWLEQKAAEASCEQSSDPTMDLFGAPQRKGGGSCGGNTCGWFNYCCNASCGICVPYGWSCTQQACDSDI